MKENRKEMYRTVLKELGAVTEGEDDAIANLANCAAVLFERLPFSWVGFYRVSGGELVLGPFQGRSACVRIARGRGVCGAAWEREEPLLVSDVHQFPGHIACDARSRSEVVIPLRSSSGTIWGLLDIDSVEPGDFDKEDMASLKEAACLIERAIARDIRFCAQ